MKLIQMLATLLALFVLQTTLHDAAADEHGQKAILVTGASTGIGRNIAETLAAKGHFVYAGARKDADIAELSAIDNIMGVRLDVTVQDDIDAAVELVRNEGRGLYGLINNAGVATIGALTDTPDADLQFVFDVNVAGVVRTTRAFAPMIVESKGRVVTTGSISGILSSATFGVYSMSKHAVEAFTDSLAAEMAPLGVSVSVVEPGNYKSRIRRTTSQREVEKAKTAGVATEEHEAMAKSWEERELAMKEPDEVSAAVVHALFSDEPQRRYMVVPEEREAEITIRKALEELAQLNQWHPYSYTRDELVAMLDETLADL